MRQIHSADEQHPPRLERSDHWVCQRSNVWRRKRRTTGLGDAQAPVFIDRAVILTNRWSPVPSCIRDRIALSVTGAQDRNVARG